MILRYKKSMGTIISFESTAVHLCPSQRSLYPDITAYLNSFERLWQHSQDGIFLLPLRKPAIGVGGNDSFSASD